MAPGSKAVVCLDGKQYNLISRWSIPPHLAEQYCHAENVEVCDITGATEFTNGDNCRGCGRHYSSATNSTRLCSNSSGVNQAFGYVVPLCIDCYYYIQWEKGAVVPRTVREKLENGHYPKNIYEYI